MMSNEVSLEQLNNLSPEERALALEILKEYSQDGYSTLLEDLKYSDFEEVPVDIMTFISDDRYLGRGLYSVDEFTGERKCTVFPYWIEKLKEIFPDNITTRYNTVILTGSIGLGKSFIAVVCSALTPSVLEGINSILKVISISFRSSIRENQPSENK